VTGGQIVATGTGVLGVVATVTVTGGPSGFTTLTLLPTQFTVVQSGTDAWTLTTAPQMLPTGIYTVTLNGPTVLSSMVTVTAATTPPAPTGFGMAIGAPTAAISISGTNLGTVASVTLTPVLGGASRTLTLATTGASLITTSAPSPALAPGAYRAVVDVPSRPSVAVPGVYTVT
jgi:hypothetical protein